LNGLQMFIPDATVAPSTGSQVFYSRRSEGPYYRWSYEHTLQQWRCVRVPTDQLPYLALSASRWKNVPRALQRSLDEHYVE
jgi:hypothetical protein